MTLEVVERPAAGATERILVLLPGFCDEPSTWTDHLDLVDPAQRWHIVVPRPPVQTRGGPAWYRVSADGPDQAALAHAVAAVGELVDGLVGRHSLTHDDVVLVGFSQGGATTLASILDPTRPVRPSAAAVIAGYLPEREGGLDLAQFAGRPMLFTHGTDDEMMDVIRGRSSAKALERAGADVTWVEVESFHRLGPPLLDPLRTWLDEMADAAATADPPTST